jgi:hypothetical protein
MDRAARWSLVGAGGELGLHPCSSRYLLAAPAAPLRALAGYVVSKPHTVVSKLQYVLSKPYRNFEGTYSRTTLNGPFAK